MRQAVRKFKETVEINSSFLNKVRSHRYYTPALLLSLFLAVACIHVWQRVQVVKYSKEIGFLREENADILDKKKKLYTDLAVLSTSSRIERYAYDTLGLKMVSADMMCTIEYDGAAPKQADDLTQMLAAVKRITEFLPVIERTRAKANVVEDISIDSTINGWGEK